MVVFFLSWHTDFSIILIVAMEPHDSRTILFHEYKLSHSAAQAVISINHVFSEDVLMKDPSLIG